MADEILGFQGKKYPNWINQYTATSGQIPSAQVLDQMIQSELDAAYKNRYYSGALALQKQRQDWEKNKDILDREQRDKDRQAANLRGLASGAAALGTTALGLWGKRDKTVKPEETKIGATGPNWWDKTKSALGFGQKAPFSEDLSNADRTAMIPFPNPQYTPGREPNTTATGFKQPVMTPGAEMAYDKEWNPDFTQNTKVSQPQENSFDLSGWFNNTGKKVYDFFAGEEPNYNIDETYP